MSKTRSASRVSKLLPALLTLYAAASLTHFAHNAEFLADYPNLPAWLTRGQVYLAWVAITLVGAVGYLLTRSRHELAGLGIVGVYAAMGLDGLLHYGRAPITAHTATMNFTIGFEVAAASLTLIAICWRVGERPWLSPPAAQQAVASDRDESSASPLHE